MKISSSHETVDLTRRSLLLVLAAALLIINPARASAPKNPEVLIIGAGPAGLGAAKTLSDLGISFLLIEAQSRIGGRAYTDLHTFGVPYDMGCHWLNYGRINPWIEYGKTNGFTVYPTPQEPYGLFVDIRKATPAELNEYDLAYNRIEKEIGWVAAKSKKPDIAPAEVIKLDTKWKKLSAYMMGPLDMAKEFDDFSCKDYWESPGADLTYVYSGGNLGGELELAGVKAGVDWGLNEVVKIYGSDVKKQFVSGTIAIFYISSIANTRASLFVPVLL